MGKEQAEQCPGGLPTWRWACSQVALGWHLSPRVAKQLSPEQGRLPWEPRASSSLKEKSAAYFLG